MIFVKNNFNQIFDVISNQYHIQHDKKYISVCYQNSTCIQQNRYSCFSWFFKEIYFKFYSGFNIDFHNFVICVHFTKLPNVFISCRLLQLDILFLVMFNYCEYSDNNYLKTSKQVLSGKPTQSKNNRVVSKNKLLEITISKNCLKTFIKCFWKQMWY